MTGQITVGPNPTVDESGEGWLSASQWELCNALETQVGGHFEGFVASFVADVAEWTAWAGGSAPQVRLAAHPSA